MVDFFRFFIYDFSGIINFSGIKAIKNYILFSQINRSIKFFIWHVNHVKDSSILLIDYLSLQKSEGLFCKKLILYFCKNDFSLPNLRSIFIYYR